MRNHFHYPTKGIGNTVSSNSNDSVNNEGNLSKRCIPKTIELTEYHPWDTVVSPHYPDSYPNNYDCTILVKTAPGFLIELLFTDFWLEEGGHRYCK
ncbi:hypothetical protein B4U80_10448 [Leptotrombidium deliense]|uniref:CUB domain-containing protein n=1 Tax=Leptotrombidium deliense TaxID=299467 RepID=A0A443SUH4_9ACAR|nr:hypothetical protein B4U80_10448 [Leptotrombidium deliense]